MNTERGSIFIVFMVLAAFFLGLVIREYFNQIEIDIAGSPIGIKKCPDGSFVMRTGSGGTFEKCPTEPSENNESNPNPTVVLDDSGAKTEDVDNISQANNRFAFDLYSEYRQENGNIFFSPFSVFSALGMVFEGARGQTSEEMQSAFRFPAKSEARLSAMAKTCNEINKADQPYQLRVANALWAQKNHPFLATYLDTVEQYYGGKGENVDFAGNTEGARRLINQWVEEKTEEKIKDLIKEGMLSPMTRLVLTNAVYFKGDWKTQFSKETTREEDFSAKDGEKTKVAMMRLEAEELVFNYTEDEQMQALELPYSGENLAMMVFLPKAGKLDDFEKAFDHSKYEQIKNGLKQEKVNIYFPKFKLETEYLMNEALQGLGMRSAFSSSADFSGITQEGKLFISDVVHKAYVDVNEEGTEAAAATGIVMRATAIMDDNGPKIFRADRPFLFAITHKPTGNILFMGRLSDPK